MSFTYYLSNIVRLFKGRVRPYTSAVLLAGGSGTRMKNDYSVTKQMMYICDKPVIVHTLIAFDCCKYIDEIVLVCKIEEISEVRRFVALYGIKKVKAIVCGGEKRSDSALLGVKSVSKKTEYVAIHDVARCLITSAQISDVVAAAYAYRASSAGCKVKDTVKRVSAKGFIKETLNREELWLAGTPQVCSLKMYIAAAAIAEKAEYEVTDDNMIMEFIGQRVKMVDTGYENIKLTTKEDLAYCETVLKRRKENENKK